MFKRSLFIASAMFVMAASHVAQAAQIPALGDVDGVVVESLMTNYALSLTQGNFVDCETTDSGTTRCAVEGGVIRIDGNGQSRVFKITKTSYYLSQIGDGPATAMYYFQGAWQQNINGIDLASPVTLVINHDVDHPEQLKGYITAIDLNVSHQVLMKRVNH